MKLQLSISTLVVALAAYTQAKGLDHAAHKRDLYAAEQPVAAADVVSARASEAVSTEYAAAAQAVQPPAVMLQAPSAQQAVVPQGPAGVQRIADTTQIFLQAQPTVAAPNAVAPAIAAAPAVAPVAAQVVAPAAPAPAAAAAPAAPAPAAAAAAAAPVAAQASAPLAALNYSEVAYAQPAVVPAAGASAAGAAVAATEPAISGVYAQQQLYPALAAAQPLVQQILPPAVQRDAVALQGGLYANAIPTAMVLNNNALVPQAVIPLDPSLTELLAQASAATATSAAVAEATTPVDDNGEEPASASESLDADDADATPAPRRKVKGKSRKAARAAKAAEANDDADNDSAVEPSNEPQDDDVPSSADAADTGTSRKSRVAAKAKGSKKGSKKSKAKDVPQDDEDAESALDSKASAAAGDLPEDTAAADLETQSGYKRIGSARQRSAHGSLRDEAAQARAEAAADARAAVLSEIRADASAEAAREASSELHIDGASIIRDEEASANRIRDAYETPRGYLRDGTDSAYSYDYTHPRSSEDEGANSSTVERYASPEYENTSTWDVAHAASWAGAHSNSYEEPHTMYHPYGSEDSYDRASYGQGDKDTSYGEYKSHYSDASPTADSVIEGSSSYSENGYPHSYSDNSDQSYGGEHEYNSQSKPFNFVNLHADSAFARDAASAAPLLSASASTLADGPHAVNDLDPLSYATQSCVMRNGLPLSASADNHPSGQSSIMVIGIPQGSAPATSVAPLASTVMVTKVITPAVKVIYASSTSASA